MGWPMGWWTIHLPAYFNMMFPFVLVKHCLSKHHSQLDSHLMFKSHILTSSLKANVAVKDMVGSGV